MSAENAKEQEQSADADGFEVSKRKSSLGVPAGIPVNFKGVGRVFYVGYSGGDVYFAELDEQGPYRWQEAIEACRLKGPGWQLPTSDQLNLLSAEDINLANMNINASSGTWYWSGTIAKEGFSIRQRFLDDLQQPVKHRFAARVRCVRIY